MQDRQTADISGPDATLQPGAILDGKFRIEDVVGSGGMGTVYRAVHLQLGNHVAVKVLHPRFATDHDEIARFHREARIISALRHKNILSVYNFNATADGHVYMAMELINGASLGQMIKGSGPLKPEQAIPILQQICEAMSCAHKEDVLHRDLKPDNVLIVDGDSGTACAKVVDFGLAKLLGSAELQQITQTGNVVGDPHYMSPEQCQGHQLDSRSDIYSFGCLMYEVFTGEKAFVAESSAATLYKHLLVDPSPFAKRCHLPIALEAITFKAMARDREKRYQSFAEVSEQLAAFAADPSLKVDRLQRRSWLSRLFDGTGSPVAVAGTAGGGYSNSRRLTIAAVLLSIVALPILLVTFAFNQRQWETANPYANLPQSALRARVGSQVSIGREFCIREQFADAEAVLQDLDRMRPHLLNEPYSEALIDMLHGVYNMEMFRKRQSPELAKVSASHLQRALAEFEAAKHAIDKSARDAEPAVRVKLDEIEAREIAASDMLLAVAMESDDENLGVQTAEELLTRIENRPTGLGSDQKQACLRALEFVFKHNARHQRLERAKQLRDRKIAFLQKHKADKQFVEQELARMNAVIDRAGK